jgi:hypothetical protein
MMSGRCVSQLESCKGLIESSLKTLLESSLKALLESSQDIVEASIVDAAIVEVSSVGGSNRMSP